MSFCCDTPCFIVADAGFTKARGCLGDFATQTTLRESGFTLLAQVRPIISCMSLIWRKAGAESSGDGYDFNLLLHKVLQYLANYNVMWSLIQSGLSYRISMVGPVIGLIGD